jgi:hypothetical protein
VENKLNDLIMPYLWESRYSIALTIKQKKNIISLGQDHFS